MIDARYTTAYLKVAALELARKAKAQRAANMVQKEEIKTALQKAQDMPVTDELAQLITVWWDQTPESRKQQSYHIEDIIRLAGLQGRWRKRTSSIWVGRALRKLGWVSYRNEKSGEPRSRLWTAPTKGRQEAFNE